MVQINKLASVGFLVVTLAAVVAVTSNTNIKHLIEQKASGGLPVTDYSSNSTPNPTQQTTPPPNTNGYTIDVVTNTVAEVNRPGYDCSKGGCAPGVIISGYYQAPNGQFYPIGGTGNDPKAYAQTSKCVAEGGSVSGNGCQTKQQKEAAEAAARRSCESKPDNQYINGQCLTVQTITTKEKTDDGFITQTTAIARDAAGNIVASNSIDTTTKTTTTYRQTDQGTVAVQTTSIINVKTGQILDTQVNEFAVAPGTTIKVNTQGTVSLKMSTGGGCKNNSDCESGLCMRNSLLQGGIYTCRANPTPTPPARTLANQELQSTYNALNYITGGKFENYIQAYSTGEFDYRWEDLGYKSLEDCKKKAGMHAGQCGVEVGTKEQLAASIDLGVDVTAKGALLVTGVGGITQVAGGAAIKVAVTQALTQTLAINAVQTTGTATTSCMRNGVVSSECGQDAAIAALSWANVGAVDYVANAVVSGSAKALQTGRVVNSAVSLAGAVPTAVGAYETCQGENANAVGCTVNVVATAAQVFAAGVDGYSFVQNLNPPLSGVANEIAVVADQANVVDNLVTGNINTTQNVTESLLPPITPDIPVTTTTTVDNLLTNTQTTTSDLLDMQFQSNVDYLVGDTPLIQSYSQTTDTISYTPEINVTSSLYNSLSDAPTIVNNFESTVPTQTEIQNLLTSNNQATENATNALDNAISNNINVDTNIPRDPTDLMSLNNQNSQMAADLSTGNLTTQLASNKPPQVNILGFEWKGFTNADGGFQFPIGKTQIPGPITLEAIEQQAASQIKAIDREFAQVTIDPVKATVTKNPYPIEHFPEYDQLTYEIYQELEFKKVAQFYEEFGGQNGIPRLLGRTPEGGFITEFIPGVPLSEFDGVLTPAEIQRATEKLKNIHISTGMAHGDLNSGNIIVNTLPDGSHDISFIDFTGASNLRSESVLTNEIDNLTARIASNNSTVEWKGALAKGIDTANNVQQGKTNVLGFEWKGFTNADGGFQFPIGKSNTNTVTEIIQQNISNNTEVIQGSFVKVTIDKTNLTVTRNPLSINDLPGYNQVDYDNYLKAQFEIPGQFYENFGGQNGIPKLLGKTPDGGLILEFVPGTALSEFDGVLTQQEIQNAIKKLEDIHALTGITHGDLNPGNIIVNTLPDGTHDIRFIDFTGNNLKSNAAKAHDIAELTKELNIKADFPITTPPLALTKEPNLITKIQQNIADTISPPIKSGEVFDATTELKGILKLPSSERQAALNTFKAKLNYQQNGAAEIQTTLESAILANPKMSIEELADEADRLIDKFGLTDTQRKKIYTALSLVDKKRTVVNQLINDYPEADDLFEAMFGRRPLGKVEVDPGVTTLHFRVTNKQDAAYIANGIFDDSYIASPHTVKGMGGFFLPVGTLVDNTQGMVVVVIESTPIGSTNALKTIIHEDQHALNKILSGSNIMPYQKNTTQIANELITALESGNADQAATALISKIEIDKLNANIKISDEILAYTKEGRDLKNVSAHLNKSSNGGDGGLYDFYGKARLENYQLMDSAITEDLANIVEASLSPTVQMNVIDQATGSVATLLNKGYTNKQVVAMLNGVPLENWNKVATRASIPSDLAIFTNSAMENLDEFADVIFGIPQDLGVSAVRGIN